MLEAPVGGEMRARTAFLAGLVIGSCLALAYLVVGPLTLVPAIGVWLLLLRRPRLAAIAGLLVGFGLVWLVVIGRATVACANDPTCTVPGFTVVWLGIGFSVLVSGIVLGLAARSGGPER